MITPAQCRGARGLLKWRQEDLAEKSEVSIVTVRNFENEKTHPHKGTLVLLRDTLESAGIEFIDGNGGGVKLRRKD